MKFLTIFLLLFIYSGVASAENDCTKINDWAVQGVQAKETCRIANALEQIAQITRRRENESRS